jgi:hypothetical protein
MHDSLADAAFLALSRASDVLSPSSAAASYHYADQHERHHTEYAIHPRSLRPAPPNGSAILNQQQQTLPPEVPLAILVEICPGKDE